MVTHKDLYGDEPIVPINKDAIQSRLDALDKRLTVVLDEHWSTRDNELKDKLLNATKFWQRLEREEIE